jgi:hypothetical protein
VMKSDILLPTCRPTVVAAFYKEGDLFVQNRNLSAVAFVQNLLI